jgi:glycosyltransferase involved in cell wall biosynthesis
MKGTGTVQQQSAPSGAIAIVTPFRATYFKPLWEAFAGAQPEGWSTELLWPEGLRSEHPEELITPVAPNLVVHRVTSRSLRSSTNHGGSVNWRAPQRFQASRELWRELSSIRPKAVLVHEYSPFSLTGLVFARWRRIPVVTLTDVGVENRTFFNPRVGWWHALWSLWIQGTAAATPPAHRPLSRRALPSVAVYHAVDSRQYQPMPHHSADGTVTFAYVGQFIPRKGLDLWVKAAALLKEQTTARFRLRFIGGGDEAWARGLVRAAGLENDTEWTGFLSGAELRKALATADVFVLPTRQDTYAVVSHEAACLGLPLLISKHAGSAEALVREGENGHIIDPEDIPAFTAAMRSLLDSDTRERMGRAARATGEEMSAHQRGRALWEWLQDNFLKRA